MANSSLILSVKFSKGDLPQDTDDHTTYKCRSYFVINILVLDENELCEGHTKIVNDHSMLHKTVYHEAYDQ